MLHNSTMRLAGLTFLFSLIALMALAEQHGQPPPSADIHPETLDLVLRMDSLVASIDARVLATLFSAFLGFLGGTLIKYGLDRRRDRLVLEQEVKILTAELRAELEAQKESLESLRDYCLKLKQAATDSEKFSMTSAGWSLLQVPGGKVYNANVGRIGILPERFAIQLVDHYTKMETIPAIVEYFGAEYEKYPDKAIVLLDNSVDRFDRSIERIKELLELSSA